MFEAEQVTAARMCHHLWASQLLTSNGSTDVPSPLGISATHKSKTLPRCDISLWFCADFGEDNHLCMPLFSFL